MLISEIDFQKFKNRLIDLSRFPLFQRKTVVRPINNQRASIGKSIIIFTKNY